MINSLGVIELFDWLIWLLILKGGRFVSGFVIFILVFNFVVSRLIFKICFLFDILWFNVMILFVFVILFDFESNGIFLYIVICLFFLKFKLLIMVIFVLLFCVLVVMKMLGLIVNDIICEIC